LAVNHLKFLIGTLSTFAWMRSKGSANDANAVQPHSVMRNSIHAPRVGGGGQRRNRQPHCASLFQCGQQIGELHSSEGDRAVCNAVGKKQQPGMDKRAAGIDDVGHIAFAFGIRGG